MGSNFQTLTPLAECGGENGHLQKASGSTAVLGEAVTPELLTSSFVPETPKELYFRLLHSRPLATTCPGF